MEITLLLHMGQRSVTLILDTPLWLPLTMATAAMLTWRLIPNRAP